MKVYSILRILGASLLASIAIIAFADTKHVVKKGESLGGIAYKYNISVGELVKHNPQASKGLRTGMVLTIPDGTSTSYDQPEEQNQPSKPATPQPAQPAQPSKPATPQPAQPSKPAQPAAITPQPSVVETPVAEEKPKDIVIGNLVVEDTADDVNDDDRPSIYSSRSGDTFESISQKFGLTVGQLIDLNPFIDPKFIPVGSIIRLSENAPIIEYIYDDKRPGSSSPAQQEPQQSAEEEETADEIEDEETADEETILEDFSPEKNTVMVLLPLMTNHEHQSKQAEKFADYYRGLLMAAYDRKDNLDYKVVIRTLDTYDNVYRIDSLLHTDVDENVAVIIAPEEENHMRVVAEYAAPRGIYVANFFNVRDESYQNNPYMLQSYINQPLMYQKGIEALLKSYPGFTPVVLMPDGGRTEKEGFVNALRARCDDEGISIIDFPFDDILSAEKIQENPNLQPGEKYVFIPLSGTPGVFNRFSAALLEYKKNAENPDYIGVFGYPDWTAYHDENRAALEEMNAIVYTRFFYDPTNYESKRVQDGFEEWYGDVINDGTPNMAILGYDTGNCILSWLQDSEGHIQNMIEGDKTYRGLQSTFRFDRINDSEGFINTALYIVKYLPDGMTIVTII